MSSDTIDLEELLFSNKDFKECLITANLISGNKIFQFLGEKSVDRFLTYVLNYKEIAKIVKREVIDNNEIISEIWIYKGQDDSWIISYFIPAQEEIEVYTNNENIRVNTLLNLLLPISIEVNYGEYFEDVTKEFISLIGAYPKLIVLEFSDEDSTFFQEENYYYYSNKKRINLLEKKKPRLGFLVYPELLQLYKDYEIINPISLLSYRM